MHHDLPTGHGDSFSTRERALVLGLSATFESVSIAEQQNPDCGSLTVHTGGQTLGLPLSFHFMILNKQLHLTKGNG